MSHSDTKPNIPDRFYRDMWNTLKKCLGERLDDETLQLMEGIECAILDEAQQIRGETDGWI